MADDMARLAAALADRYRVERELGKGGMATVYLAHDLRHHRQVALKVLQADVAAAVGPERFLREIEISAGLDHPHILPLFDSGAAAGFLFYVMPYVEGGTLRDRLRREKQLPLEDALRIAREVADALSHAHSHGVVHRDIKPENILLAGGHARVADFGIARAISAAGGERLTQTGLAVGTPAYMSPEQAAGSADVDGRSDLYSLGCVLFEMLAGEPPFTGAPPTIIRQHLVADPPPITSRRPAVPAPVAAAIMRTLSKTPADRFSPAAQFAEALRAGEAAPPVASAAPRSGIVASPPLAAGAFGLVSVLVLAVVYLLVLQVGLPTWVFGGAAALLVVGLPIITAAAAAERGRARTGAPAGLLSMRNAVRGGAVAFTALALVTGSWVVMRATGVGPAASLLSRGAITERERVILADFESRTNDSIQGATVTELMRVGLSRSQVVSIVDPGQVGRILELMRRSLAGGLPAPVALEVAARDGIKAVITGEIVPVGRGLTLTARLVTVAGEVLVAETETAAGADELVGAVDRLSGRLRERFGESLQSIRANEPLDKVTTRSLDALRVFTLALRAVDQGDDTRAMQLLDEAIAMDSSFAMAYRKLAIILNNAAEQRARSIWAAGKAYQYRENLTERERYLVMAAYESVVTGNRDLQISNYRNVLDRYPDDTYALNNLGVIYSQLRDYPRAAEYYARTLAVDSSRSNSYSNMAEVLARRMLFDSADAVARRFQRRFPTNPEVKLAFLINEAMRLNYDSAAVLVEGLLADQRGTVYWEAIAYEWWGHLDALRGRIGSAGTRWREAFRLTQGRRLEGTYLLRTARRALAERMLLDDPARARALLDDALTRFPLAGMSPLDRPYGHLAMALAAAGELDRARALVREFEDTPEADHSAEAERWAHGARAVIALEENRPADAIASFRALDDGNACATCAAPWLGRTFDRMSAADSARVHYETFVGLPSADLWYDDAHLHHALQRLGEIYEAEGDTAKAVESWRRLANMLANADPVLATRRDYARSAIVRLTGEARR
jgi:tetratricopeptide (TPR) repeat protein